MTAPLDLSEIRARHDVFETYLQQMPHHAAAVTLDLRVRTLHADRAALLAALEERTRERESLRLERDAIFTKAQRDNAYLIGQRDAAEAEVVAIKKFLDFTVRAWLAEFGAEHVACGAACPHGVGDRKRFDQLDAALGEAR